MPTPVLNSQEEAWLNETHGLAQGVHDYWFGSGRPSGTTNGGFPWAGWMLAASADVLNVANNSDRHNYFS